MKNFGSYRIESKPPSAGEPIITAIVMTVPNKRPTIMKRLFTVSITHSLL